MSSAEQPALVTQAEQKYDEAWSSVTSGGLEVGDVPPHLARGIKLWNITAYLGHVLRIRPDSLPKEDQTALWQLSCHCPRLA